MKNKEAVYDEQIFPLMKQIIEICTKEHIPVFAYFQYAKDEFVKTMITSETGDSHCIFKAIEALSQCAEKEGINIDKFMLWVMREFPNKSSIVLKLLGKEPDPGSPNNQAYTADFICTDKDCPYCREEDRLMDEKLM